MLYLKIIAIPCLVLSNEFVHSTRSTTDLNIHPEHVPYVLFSEISQTTIDKPTSRCWGYERNCSRQRRYSEPDCPGSQTGWAPTKIEQIDTFFNQGDFGYVKQQRDELTYMCEPTNPDDSSLECTNHLKFCRGHNIKIDFKNLLNQDRPFRYQMDVLSDGQIGGKCKFYKEKLHAQCDHLSPLQSWSPELRFFSTINDYPGKCDLVFTKPTIIMKIDATVNMYHHFCDFLNLYASQHVNSTGPDMFSKDVHILIWESFPYESAFSDTFKIEGCERSGLFKSFSQHMLHRLSISQTSKSFEKIKITFLSRNTRYRNVLNENELISALRNNTDYDVKKVIYNGNYLSFTEQVRTTHNSDIFIGMHGAGLTHLLFLPDWAVLFELYNCEDEHCYKDLARLRGIKYLTWQDIEKLHMEDKSTFPDNGAHAKFTNYSFDKNEFLRLVAEAAEHVKKHKHGYGPKSHDEL
ncbi:EGF domain-specific O-linked N-acetylglucosamine transferase isoform X2 [Adelges cooleyi]|uniref:EGF domain-specific O-linked N-acetylglucosamine transferase isoform X2 n=1 Tax=Adelges cooleyi TaxID=133065 RepID=UPI00217F86FB|nr:EGF domain-specific O-linked N-acetylglucosamine transferase isoform X2 [Adelges cooleyi]